MELMRDKRQRDANDEEVEAVEEHAHSREDPNLALGFGEWGVIQVLLKGLEGGYDGTHGYSGQDRKVCSDCRRSANEKGMKNIGCVIFSPHCPARFCAIGPEIGSTNLDPDPALTMQTIHRMKVRKPSAARRASPTPQLPIAP